MARFPVVASSLMGLVAISSVAPRTAAQTPPPPAQPAPTEAPPAGPAPTEAAPSEPVPPADTESDPEDAQEPSAPVSQSPPEETPPPPRTIPPVQPATAPNSQPPAAATSEGAPTSRETLPASPPPADSTEQDDGAADEPATKPRLGQWLGLELSAGMNANHRFTTTDRSGRSEQAVDSVLAAALHLDFDASWGLFLGYEHAGIGKERFDIDPAGNSLDATYSVDTLWLGARFYFDRTRPSWYVGAGVGPALQRVRGVGTRSRAPFNASGTPFECEEIGGLGAGLRAGAGAEVDLAGGLSFVSDLSAIGHVLPGAADALGGCAPGAGPAIQGLLRVGLAYRFPL